jgi:hypothetical protein
MVTDLVNVPQVMSILLPPLVEVAVVVPVGAS